MDISTLKNEVFRRQVALPQDHGSWVFLLSPLLIGLSAGGRWRVASAYLVAAALAAFLARQPVTLVVKVLSGRRPRRELGAAVTWTVLYGLAALAALAGLAVSGYAYLAALAVPALLAFAWHLLLVSRRAERRNLEVELAGSGVLALAAPAALWVGVGSPTPLGWLLWLLAWCQSAASIVYAYMRLEQRAQKYPLPLGQRLSEKGSLTLRAWLYAIFNVLVVAFLALAHLAPAWLALPYAVQLGETLWGSFYPATGWKPTAIGIRQLVVSTLFTGLFIIIWRAAH